MSVKYWEVQMSGCHACLVMFVLHNSTNHCIQKDGTFIGELVIFLHFCVYVKFVNFIEVWAVFRGVQLSACQECLT
jgi:hypothetical protein